MPHETYRPDWVPEGGGEGFSCRVMTGVTEKDGAGPLRKEAPPPRKNLTLDDYEAGILNGDRMILSRAITLIESNAPRHFDAAQELVQRILPHTGRAIRVGITGVPGAGKSTFIETLGCTLCREDHKVAVLAVDPSSTVSGGSILGDKTRMEQLARETNAFIRPSPSSGTLGGVTRKSRETLLLCEAAGYDVILVETVGVGQSETTVRSMVDFFMVLVLTGAGDDLQGIKKGVIELADAIVVNKADGDNKRRAMITRADYNQILHYLRPATEGWTTQAYTCSSLTGEDIDTIWDVVLRFRKKMEDSGFFQRRRSDQALQWVDTMVQEFLHHRIVQNPIIAQRREDIRALVERGETPPTKAARMMIDVMEDALFS
ncbi:MAG: methylmalonyl Co-A mutase-associated GTPase MeaB [Dethiosulfovibrio peptidovorans]|nr:MAG: methylmalonyl Co-A mutase-associated GTPase MeaB [Dethiosulfovibrio peptidovorans]